MGGGSKRKWTASAQWRERSWQDITAVDEKLTIQKWQTRFNASFSPTSLVLLFVTTFPAALWGPVTPAFLYSLYQMKTESKEWLALDCVGFGGLHSCLCPRLCRPASSWSPATEKDRCRLMGAPVIARNPALLSSLSLHSCLPVAEKTIAFRPLNSVTI